MKLSNLSRQMRSALRLRWAAVMGTSLLMAGAVNAQTYLWQIGSTDTNDNELALAPGGYTNYLAAFPSDTTYIVGVSTPQASWPYVQPGPADAWAGSNQHTFNVLFGLQSVPTSGNCQLDFALLDRNTASSQLEIIINGQNFSITLPPGTGASTLSSASATGQEYKFSVPFPATTLKTGLNQVQIMTLSGSWLIYDSLGLEAVSGAVLTNVTFSSSVAMSGITPAGNLIETNGVLVQPTQITLTKSGSAVNGFIQIGNAPATPVTLNGVQTITAFEPDVTTATNVLATITSGGQVLGIQQVTVQPVKHLTIYLHLASHNDIGYTDSQANITALHVNNVALGIQYANQTASYPAGARFVWDPECCYSEDMYLSLYHSNPQAISNFLSAVTNGQLAVEGMYLNELSALCRPEELINAYRTSSKLADLTGVPVVSAGETDLPGYTWGSVTAMAQAGIKYFSPAPNQVHRIGYILQAWQNKPFYWLGPDGQSKVLAWLPYYGYQPAKYYGTLTPSLVSGILSTMDPTNYPYDMTYIRWDFVADNAVISSSICDQVKNWNTTNAYPRFAIASLAQIFSAFEQKYSNSIPVYSGDWTPSWEDGAGTSAHETAINRNTSDRLTQAETLFAIIAPTQYSPTAFYTALTNVLLYTEHTFGASDSVSNPSDSLNQSIWAVKQGYATNASAMASNLLVQAENSLTGTGAPANAVDVYNTLSWSRSELVLLPPAQSTAGDQVLDDQGLPVVSQRLTTGELAFMATNVPPLAARRYTVVAGSAYAPAVSAAVSPANATLDNGILHVQLNPTTGGITLLTDTNLSATNLVDLSTGENVNDYQYQLGTSMPTSPVLNGQVTITTGETGPLVASLIVQSTAPGCNTLRRELRIVAGQDYLQLNNFMDKTQVASGYYESVNFAFPFNIPGGSMLLDLPLAAMRPGLDQLPGSCYNWLTIGRWADIANTNYGVTWVTLDSPLIEVGSRTATLFGNVADTSFMSTNNNPGQKVYAWVMSNDWDTNYQPYQPGQTTFRFLIHPHLPSGPNSASRFAIPFSQPLIPVAATTAAPISTPLVTVNSPDINVISLKPSEDGTGAMIVRLFGASGTNAAANLAWAKTPAKLWISNTDEKEVTPLAVGNPVNVAGWGVVTLRAEMQ